MTTETQTRGAGYVRVSTDRQETDRQIAAIRAYAAANDINLTRIIEEDGGAGQGKGISGRSKAVKGGRPDLALSYYAALASENFGTLERSGYADLLRSVVSGEITVVIFYALDRFSRDTIELLLLELILRKYGVAIIALNSGAACRTDTAAGKFSYRLMAALAEMECDQSSERTSATLRNMVSRGEKVGRPPVGWRAILDSSGHSTGQFEHHPEEWKLVEEAINMSDLGASYAEIGAAIGKHPSGIKRYLDSAKWIPPAGPARPAAPELDLSSGAPATEGKPDPTGE